MANAVTHLETAAVIDLTDWNAAHVVTFIGAKAYNAAVQSISSSSETPLTFDSEEFDSDAFHDTGSNTSRFTIPSGKAGKYLVQAGGFANSAGSPQAFFKINGTTRVRGGTEGVNDTNKTLSAIVSLAVGDYIEVRAWQSSGGPLDWGHASSAADQWAMSIVYLGA